LTNNKKFHTNAYANKQTVCLGFSFDLRPRLSARSREVQGSEFQKNNPAPQALGFDLLLTKMSAPEENGGGPGEGTKDAKYW
jgi:hypothetical protein